MKELREMVLELQSSYAVLDNAKKFAAGQTYSKICRRVADFQVILLKFPT